MSVYTENMSLYDNLQERGISRWDFAPPLYRLLWKMNIKIPPPVFSGQFSLVMFQSIMFFIIISIGVSIVTDNLIYLNIKRLAILILTSILYGAFVGDYFNRMKKRYNLSQ
ncbi:hypothetical protein KAR48_18745 [bacterium]|nr:hypothetical protein [bacterium]